jgi:hypothetical protein
LVVRCRDDLEEIGRRRRTGRAVNDLSIFSNDYDSALNSTSVWFERAIVRRCRHLVVDEELKRQLELIDELLMTVGAPMIDAEWFGIERPELAKCLAHGGQLVRSAGCLVLRIKDQKRSLDASQVAERRHRATCTAQ